VRPAGSPRPPDRRRAAAERAVVSELQIRGEPAAARSWNGDKSVLFLGILVAVVASDLATKLMVQNSMYLYQQIDLIGDYLRFTFIYNPGAAFGIQLGPHSRAIFVVLSVAALGALMGMYWVTPAVDRVRLAAISLICGGAIGNLIDRIRSPSGVVDFIDIGIGDLRWPVFNIADIAVTSGAIFLALSLWREEQEDGAVR
jgi:signal peptidase II